MKNTWWLKYLNQSTENGHVVHNYKIHWLFMYYIKVKVTIRYFYNKLR
jgi:hypothetical protein